MKNKTYIIEVEKALDWKSGFLNWKGDVVTDIKEAQAYDNEEDAEDAAATFNIDYGRAGRIYARVI